MKGYAQSSQDWAYPKFAQFPQNNITLGQWGHPATHRHFGAIQCSRHLFCGGWMGRQISWVGKGPPRCGPRGDEPLQHPCPLPPTLRRWGSGRPERLQRQNWTGHRGTPYIGPPALRRLRRQLCQCSALHRHGAHPVGRRQLRLEGSGRWRNYSAGNLQGSAGIHCPISQRRPAHSGGAAHHHPDPPPGRLYLRAHLSNHSQRGVHHWPHRQAVSGLTRNCPKIHSRRKG